MMFIHLPPIEEHSHVQFARKKRGLSASNVAKSLRLTLGFAKMPVLKYFIKIEFNIPSI